MNLKVYKKTSYPNIYQHIENGKYAIDISIGRDQLTGRRLRTTRTGINTEKEAKKILNDTINKKNIRNKLRDNYDFVDLSNEYFEYCEKVLKLKNTTITKKRATFRRNVIPMFKSIKITKITEDHIKMLHTQLIKDKRINNTTRHKIHCQLSSFLNWCMNQKGIIDENPARRVKNFPEEKKVMDYWIIDEFNEFLKVVEEDLNTKRRRIALMIIAITKQLYFGGYRIGELLALTENDIKKMSDEEYAVSISKAVYYMNGNYILGDPKTMNSCRMLYFGKNSITPLFEYIDYIKTEMQYPLREDDYIFTNPQTNKLYSTESIRHLIDGYIKKAGVKRLRIHDFRHSYASLLINEGWNLHDVKDRMGHSSIEVTSDTYGHLYNSTQRKIGQSIDKYA